MNGKVSGKSERSTGEKKMEMQRKRKEVEGKTGRGRGKVVKTYPVYLGSTADKLI